MSERLGTTERADAAERSPKSGAAAPGRGGRMSPQRKTTAVLGLLRGQDPKTMSRGLGVIGEQAKGQDRIGGRGEGYLPIGDNVVQLKNHCAENPEVFQPGRPGCR
jgi:hypothetical protein